MSNVTALARGPLSGPEALVMYASAVEGAARKDLPALTGLPEPVIDDAIAQLIRRGLIKPTNRRPHRAAKHDGTRSAKPPRPDTPKGPTVTSKQGTPPPAGTNADPASTRSEQHEYSVTWTIELTANSQRAAAAQALAIQRDARSLATVFDVRRLGALATVRIDLADSDE